MLAYIQTISPIGTISNMLVVCLFFFISFSTTSFASQDELAILPTSVLSSENFPCSKCHKQNRIPPEVQKEAFHSKIRVVGHIEEEYGCFGCHDSEDLDKLRLFSDRVIDLAVSSELCGQCHSTNYKLWQSGLHGKVVGKWNGPKKYTPCTTCHDPHRPGYMVQRPEPPPTPPEQTLRWRR